MKALEKQASLSEKIQAALHAETKRLKRSDVLVVTEKEERFSLIDRRNCMHMSKPRCKVVLKDHWKQFITTLCEEQGLDPSKVSSKIFELAWGQIDPIINHALTHNAVSGVLDGVSGYGSGLVSFGHDRYLIRNSIVPVEPRKGQFENIRIFLETAMGKGHSEPDSEIQLHALHCLLNAKLQQMLSDGANRSRGSCPLLVLISKPGEGKSLMAELFGQLLGQTSPIDPSGERNGWNDALLNHAVLCYDEASREEFSYGDGISRSKFAEEFKRGEYSSAPTIATRGAKARVIPAHWLWMRALNDDSRAALNQTPVPTENGMDDKLIILKFHKATVPRPGEESIEARKARWATLVSELPAFAWWLLKEFPRKRRSDLITRPDGSQYRNLCHPYYHPEMLVLLDGSENDHSKQELFLDFVRSPHGDELFTGSWRAGKIFTRLHQLSDCSDEAKRVLAQVKSAEALGYALSRAATLTDPWVEKTTRQGSNAYKFKKSCLRD